MEQLKAEQLKQLANQNPTSTAVMVFLALRERNPRNELVNLPFLKAQLIRMGEKIVEQDFTNFWKSLESLGIGNYISGRRGNPDRFKMHYSLRDVTKLAIEGKESEAQEMAKKQENRVIVPRKRRKPGRPAKVEQKEEQKSEKRARLSREAKQIERRVMQTVREALLGLQQ